MKDFIRQTWAFTIMKIKDRYMGTTFGAIWAVLNPLLLLGIYTFVFGFVLKGKAPGSEKSIDYALWMITGLGPWLSMAESLTESTQSIVGSSGLIKNMSFRAEALPLAGVLVGLLPLGITMIFLIGLMVLFGDLPSWHIIFLLPAVILQLMFVTGLGFFFAGINVFFRDFGILLSTILLVAMLASPIFFSLEQYPAVVRPLAAYNPLYIIFDTYRRAVIYQQMPDFFGFIGVAVLSVIMIIGGLAFFRKLRPYFEGVL